MQVTRIIAGALLAGVVMLMVFPAARARVAASNGPLEKVRGLDGGSLRANQVLLVSLGQQRVLLGRILVEEVNSPHPDTRDAAIYLLAAFRMSRGTEAILRQIDFQFQPPKSSRIFVAPPGPYPAEWALVRIGEPSVRAILKLLPVEANALRRKLMVRVLVGVEGRAVTQFRLQRALAKAGTAAIKKNLNAALRDLPPPPAAHK